MMMLLAVSLVMQAADVRLVISDGIGNGALKTTMERSVSELLNTVNRAVADSMSALPTDGPCRVKRARASRSCGPTTASTVWRRRLWSAVSP